MNDEQMQSALDEWFEDTDPQPPNAQRTATHVLAHVPQTRQRGRWLPFRLLRPKAERPTATETTSSMSPSTSDTHEYNTSPVPPTNGQAPTMIGRTTSMLSPAKAIIAGTVVFTIGGALLIAQPFDQPGNVPGAAIDPCTTPITPVTGRIIWGEQEPNPQWYSSDAGIHVRDYGYVSTMEVDDDRLDGRSTGAVDWDLGHQQTTGVNEGTFRIDNDEGAWEGTWTGIARSTASWKAVIDLAGTGAYEGLSARLFTESGATGPVDGSVYPTDIASCYVSTGE